MHGRYLACVASSSQVAIQGAGIASSRPALSSARSIILTNFTLVRVEKGYPVRIVLDLGHQSSLIKVTHSNGSNEGVQS